MENNILKLTENNDIEGVRKAIAEGVDVNVQDRYSQGGNDWTALMIAIVRNQFEIVELLLEAKANLYIKDICGKTALDYAIMRNNRKIIELLKNHLKPIKVIVPTSKVIQINTNQKEGDLIQTALCEDGSVWIYVNEKWTSILNNLTN